MANIIIIEDESFLLFNLKFLLEIEGYKVNAFEFGADGVEYAKNNPVDLIICDINMEGMNGYEVLQAIRTNPKTKVTPFIFLTALLDRDDIRKGMDLGADDYIPKPYTNEIVINAVKSRLEKHKLVNNYLIEKIDNTKKDLVATIPNEFKTPLVILNTYSEKLIQLADTIGRDEIIEIAEVIKSSSGKLNKIFNDFSFYFELFNFKPNSDNAITVNPNKIIKDVISEKLNEKEKSYELILDETIYSLKINSLHFKKIIEEVIENAINTSDDVNKITVKNSKENDLYVLEVYNSGINSEEIISNKEEGAFKRFNRSMQNQQGVGLGLGIVKKIMSLYNYELKIENINGYSKIQLYFKILN